MKGQRLFCLLAIVLLNGLAVAAMLNRLPGGASATVSGAVVGENGALAGARVRVRATENLVFTDGAGRFELTGVPAGVAIEVTGWYTGYYIASRHVTPTVSGITLTLRPYHTVDHPEYSWTSPISGTTAGACGSCHPSILPQWTGNAHGGAVANPRFYSLYDGTTISGTVVVTPGYRLDFPGTAGNCANCHAPGMAVDGYLTTNMDDVRSVITAGVHCDFCHKVGGVYLNPASGTVYPNAPGVQSQQVLRPPPGDNIFFGPYDDVHDPDTYLPLIAESQFCAVCHQFAFWGTPIYESFDEWLASPYATAGITCQDCHMPPNGDSYFALPEVGGLPHPPEQIPSHFQLGATDSEFLQSSVELTTVVRQVARQLIVTVLITNTGAGHHIPTDFPGRNLILVVAANEEGSDALPLLSGTTVPAWGGAEADLPGAGFAKILQDVATGRQPVVSYWKPTAILSDNRIPAMGAYTADYVFELPLSAAEVEITTQLYFRRLFQPLASARGWQAPQIEIAAGTVSLATEPVFELHLPAICR